MRNLIDNQNANLHQAIERTYNVKCAPFDAAIRAKVRKIDYHLDQILKKKEREVILYFRLYPNVNDPRITNLRKEIKGHEEAIKALKKEISRLQDDLGKIYEWREKMVKWTNEKHRKENEALEAHYEDCLANESDDD